MRELETHLIIVERLGFAPADKVRIAPPKQTNSQRCCIRCGSEFLRMAIALDIWYPISDICSHYCSVGGGITGGTAGAGTAGTLGGAGIDNADFRSAMFP